MNKKTVLTIIGIRPDAIRYWATIKRLDECDEINHVILATGQHFDPDLTDNIYEDLGLRKPDYNLGMGYPGRPFDEQVAHLFPVLKKALIEINPDFVMTLGDTNSVLAGWILRRMANQIGYKIGRVEAGMRAHSWELPEEINRIMADTAADYFFVYTHDNVDNLHNEGKKSNQIFLVGNTIVEPMRMVLSRQLKCEDYKKYVVADIHREENVEDKSRLSWIVDEMGQINYPVKLLKYKRLEASIKKFGFTLPENVEFIPLQIYSKYVALQNGAIFMFNDSGSAIEEAPILGVPLIVPRESTERQIAEGNAFVRLPYGHNINNDQVQQFIQNYNPDNSWLGDGNTSKLIVDNIKNILKIEL